MAKKRIPLTPEEAAAKKKVLVQLAGVGLSMGSELIACVVVGLYLGRWLDTRLGWAPYGTLFSILLFMAGALVHIFYMVTDFQKKLNRMRDAPDPKE